MSSRSVVDLRKRKAGAAARLFPTHDSPKRETLRARRKRARFFIILLVAPLLVLIGYAVSFASYLPRFAIERVDVEGTHSLRPKLLEAYVATKLWDGSPEFFSESNFFFYPRGEIEKAVQEFFPRVERVHISRVSMLGNAVTISIEERKPFARWCKESTSCYAIDRSGVIFAPASTTAAFETPYVFEGALTGEGSPLAQAYLPGRFPAVVALLERLGQASFSANRITITGDQDFSILLEEGFPLKVSFGTDVGTVVKNLELVLASDALRGRERELEYVDLRFGNRIYYKWKGGEEGSL